MTDTLYMTADELKASLELADTTFADEDVARALPAACRGIDMACNRHFYRTDPSNDQVRYYSPNRPLTLEIDDMIGLTSVLVDCDGDGTFETERELNVDFVAEPLNASADGRPWTQLRVTGAANTARRYWPFTVARSVQVTGQFGWAAVPDPIVEATGILAARLLKRAREAPFGIIALGVDTAGRIAKTDPDVQFLIEPYIREIVLA